MKIKTSLFITCLLSLGVSMFADELSEMTPRDGIARLVEGNKRFLSSQMTHHDRNKERRLMTVDQQWPFAVILGCSDSRVSPEILFDQGIGDLFIVRDAGNVVGAIELESILYSVTQLRSKVILVMGHQNCGAVDAVMNNNDSSIPAIAGKIRPAIERVKEEKGTLKEAIIDNVYHSVDQLKANPILEELLKTGKLTIRGAYYNFNTGEVEILSPI